MQLDGACGVERGWGLVGDRPRFEFLLQFFLARGSWGSYYLTSLCLLHLIQKMMILFIPYTVVIGL